MNNKTRIVDLQNKLTLLLNWKQDNYQDTDQLIEQLCPDKDYDELIDFIVDNSNTRFNKIYENYLKDGGNCIRDDEYFIETVGIAYYDVIYDWFDDDPKLSYKELSQYYQEQLKNCKVKGSDC